MTDPITRLNAAREGRYRIEREIGEGGMRYASRLAVMVGLIALTACGGHAPVPRAPGSPSPFAAPVELPLGAGRPEVEGITRTVLSDNAVRTVTRVRFADLPDDWLDWYVATDEPYDKAGGYAVQGRAALFISGLVGSWSNVVGLPMELLPSLFRSAGQDLVAHLSL